MAELYARPKILTSNVLTGEDAEPGTPEKNSSRAPEAAKDSKDDSHLGRDAAIGGGAAAAAGGLAYAATTNDDKAPMEPPKDPASEQAKNLTTVKGTDEKNPSKLEDGSGAASTAPVPQEAAKDDLEKKDDSHLGRDAAIGGGAAAAAGGVAYAATRDHDDKDKAWPEPPKDQGAEQAKNLTTSGAREPPRDVGREQAKNLTTKEPGSPEKNPSRLQEGSGTPTAAPVPQEANKDDLEKKDDSHLGRDAAIAGGVGAAGGAAACTYAKWVYVRPAGTMQSAQSSHDQPGISLSMYETCADHCTICF